MRPTASTPEGALATVVGGTGRLIRQPPRFVKFVVIGCINAVVSYATFTLALLLTHADNLSVVITWSVGIVFNFFSTGRLVFGNRDFRRAVPFVLSYGVSMIINLALINVLLALGFASFLAQALCLPVVVVISYFINARFVFRRSTAEPGGVAGS